MGMFCLLMSAIPWCFVCEYHDTRPTKISQPHIWQGNVRWCTIWHVPKDSWRSWDDGKKHGWIMVNSWFRLKAPFLYWIKFGDDDHQLGWWSTFLVWHNLNAVEVNYIHLLQKFIVLAFVHLRHKEHRKVLSKSSYWYVLLEVNDLQLDEFDIPQIYKWLTSSNLAKLNDISPRFPCKSSGFPLAIRYILGGPKVTRGFSVAKNLTSSKDLPPWGLATNCFSCKVHHWIKRHVDHYCHLLFVSPQKIFEKIMNYTLFCKTKDVGHSGVS